MTEFEHVCGNYDDDDQVCVDCVRAGVQRQQSCYVKPGADSVCVDKVYRIIAEDGDIVVLKEVRSE